MFYLANVVDHSLYHVYLVFQKQNNSEPYINTVEDNFKMWVIHATGYKTNECFLRL